MFQRTINLLTTCLILLIGIAQAQTQTLQEQFAAYEKEFTAAGVAFEKNDSTAAAQSLKTCQQLMASMISGAKTSKQRGNLKPHFEKLSAAINAVNQKGGEVEALPSWADYLKSLKSEASSSNTPTQPTTNEVSFTRDIAPMLNQRCGNCHIRRSSGELSMASFDAIRKGAKGVPLITPGNASASRIIEVIEDGSMPQGNQKLTEQELASLKKWLDEGAKFDGKNTSDTILVAATPAPATPMASDFKPAEKQTVSFARELAPIFVANCNGCHLDAMQIRGNLNLNTFTGLENGGASGPSLVKGNAKDSLLIQKLRGSAGARMPMNRPALDDATIAKFETWINEGAVFDGDATSSSTRSVAEQAWIENASIEELKARRLEVATASWNRVYTNREAYTASGDTFVVLSDSSEATAERILKIADDVASTLVGPLGIGKGKPLFPSGATIFAFDKRYDYSEFGKMAESRSLPSHWTAHWRREGVNVYVAMSVGSQEDEALERDLKMNLTSLWASSFDDMPRWFADGLGAYAFAGKASRTDDVVVRLEQTAMRSVGGLKSVQPLITGTMNEEDAAAIGYLALRALNQGPNRKRYDAFLKQLNSTKNFNTAFNNTFGPLEPAIAGFLGIQAK
jgi:mono/diheme cytochrome c family protein